MRVSAAHIMAACLAGSALVASEPTLFDGALQEGNVVTRAARSLLQPGGAGGGGGPEVGAGADAGAGAGAGGPGDEIAPASATAAVAPMPAPSGANDMPGATEVTTATATTPAEGDDLTVITIGTISEAVSAPAGSTWGTVAPSSFYGSYVINDEDYGTEVEVEVTDTTREIFSNGIPPFSLVVDEFDSIEFNTTVSLPLEPTFVGTAAHAITIGISVLGVRFEPGNNEKAQCEDGTELQLEVFNNTFVDFGFSDGASGHFKVDQTGTLYHYHAPLELEPQTVEESQDLVHVGFAYDGHLMYYSRSNAYPSSFVLSTEPRHTSSCNYTDPQSKETFDIDPTPDGSLTPDWVLTEGAGALDECNGVEIDGEYVYFITDDFPWIPRCLMGEAVGGGAGGMGGGGDMEMGGGAPGEAAGEEAGAGAGPGETTDEAGTDATAASPTEATTTVTSFTVGGAPSAAAVAALFAAVALFL